MKHFLHKISLLTAAVALTLSAFAQKIERNGIHYTLDADKFTATVTYPGDTPEGNSYSGEIDIPGKFKHSDGEYYRVTAIGEKAFYGCKGISYINIGGLIAEIGSEAFAGNDMTSLVIPENVTSIAEDAFNGSNISIFTPIALEDYSFLKGVTASVFVPEANMEAVSAIYSGEVKNIDTHYYIEDLSTANAVRFRIHTTEYYSLPNTPEFEVTSVNTYGVWAKEDGDIYYWDGMSIGQTCEFDVSYYIDGEGYRQIEKFTAQPQITCEESEIGTTTFTATITKAGEEDYTSTESGIVIDGTKYAADANGKVEIDNLAEATNYTAKPYAVYNNKTYYGKEFVFNTKSTTGIGGITADNEAKITLNNLSRNGYIEVAISSEADITYSIINITGQKELEGTIAGGNKMNTISTSELSSGIYMLNINGGKINKTIKFIIR